MIESPSDFIILFDDMSGSYGKIFVPDNFDDKIVENIIKFIKNRDESLGIIPLAIKRYLTMSDGMVTSIRDFANKFPDHYLTVKDNQEQKERINKLMNSTEKRMKDTERDDLN